MARKKGSKDYPLSIKLEAIRLWEEEDLSYKEITERLAIRDPKRVKEWMRIYRKEGKAGLKKPRRGRSKKGPDSLEERIKQLEMENTLFKSIGHRARGRIARGARYRAIYRYRRQFRIKDACVCLRVSRSAYYSWVKRMDRPDSDQDRNQLTLFPEALDDYISADNPVRFLDAFVGTLDIKALGFKNATLKITGRPPYHPGDLLRLSIYGYLNRFCSSRKSRSCFATC